MQYKEYEIQITEYGCIIRNNIGNYISSTPTELEANEYIDELVNENKEEQPINWIKQFNIYCKHLHKKLDRKIPPFKVELVHL